MFAGLQLSHKSSHSDTVGDKTATECALKVERFGPFKDYFHHLSILVAYVNVCII